MDATANDKRYYLIEASGETRYVWGPYSLSHARREAGERHMVATGDGLTHGGKLTRGEVQAAVQSGRIKAVSL